MEFRTPWDADPLPNVLPSLPEAIPTPPKKRGRRPAACPGNGSQVMPPREGRWLYHHLTISGSAARVALFAETARGSGVAPWGVDGARIEEDVFNLAASQPQAMRSLTIEGCRILARQFRERVEARAARAAALVGRSRACPFDLHKLLPVPAEILRHEPTHPEARAWLPANWGLCDMPRHVAERPRLGPGRRLPTGHAVIRLRLLHEWRDTPPGDGEDRGRLAGSTLRAAAGPRRLTAPGMEGHAHVPMAAAPTIGTPLTGDSAWDDWDSPPRLSVRGVPAAGSPAAPMLHLEGFDEPMDRNWRGHPTERG